jgi:short subunit dehydrogenase-like uncharacterized protein
MPERKQRDLDVVVFGATSVTGRRVAAYLHERAAEGGGSWAPAARDAAKLERTMAEVGADPAESIAADVGDPDSLLAMTSRAKVVLNLVGPYTRYATPVIEACVEGGAHYVDLTGEIPFVRRVIDRYDGPAREAGVKIVQVAGFEALPPDLGVRLAREAAAERFGQPLEQVDLVFDVLSRPSGIPRPGDIISGGTLQSMAEMAVDPDASLLTDSAALIDDPADAQAVRRQSPIAVAPRRGADGSVLGPMAPSAFINPAIIQRSAALAAAEAGERFHPFRYREGFAIAGPAATLPLRYAAAGTMSGFQAGLGRLLKSGESVRGRAGKAMRSVLPDSGFGPTTEDRLEGWHWRMAITGTAAGGESVEVAVDADGHPGYLATARMLGEAGLMLADDGATPDLAGCVTPAQAIGTAEIGRFERAHLRFSVA